MYVPENIVTNDDLSKIMETSNEWIIERTGIKERRHIKKGDGNSTVVMGVKAAKIAIERAGIDKDDIDLILFATLSPDYYFPGSGVLAQEELDIPTCPAMDIRNQCSGFIYAISTADQFIKSGMYKNILVIGSENHSGGLDFTTRGRGVSVIFGDGGGGVLIEQTDDDYGIVDSILKTDGSGNQFLTVPAGGSRKPASETTVKQRLHYVYQDGKTVFKYAVNRMSEVSKEIIEKNKLSSHDIKLFIPHQANQRIIDATAKKCGLDSDQVFVNIDKYGNTTAGTIPIAIDEANKMNLLESGELLLLSAFGGGFTWGSMLIRWGKIL